MNSMNLKDFKPDPSEFDEPSGDLNDLKDPLGTSGYQEEINTLKIDKLSNRVTIISIIIPVMVIAILIFAYIDMKERVVDVDLTKQSQVEKVSQQLEEKLNALDVKIAKNRFEIEKYLPQLDKKTIALEGQLAKMSSSKADRETVKQEYSKLTKLVNANKAQDKSTLASINKINQDTLKRINQSQEQFNAASKQIKEEIALFKEEFDARLLELSDYEEQIGIARKDLSLLDKKFNKLEKEYLQKTEFEAESKQIQEDMAKLKSLEEQHVANLKKQLSELKRQFSSESERLSRKIDQLSKTKNSSTVPASSPAATIKAPQTSKPPNAADTATPAPIQTTPLKE